jgi:hypothetical protein
MILNGALAAKKLSYAVTASSTASGITVEPESVKASRGDSVTVVIHGNSLSGVSVRDNGSDIKNQLISHAGTQETVSSLAKSYTTQGTISSGSSYAANPIDVAAETTTTTSGNMRTANTSTTAYVFYAFDFSQIPDDVVIDSVQVKVKGHRQSSSTPASLTLMAGNTVKSNTTAFSSTSDKVVTVANGSYTWTLTELKSNPKLRVTVGRYGVGITGITWSVTYTKKPYWEYQLDDIAASHHITVS